MHKFQLKHVKVSEKKYTSQV